MNNSLSIKFTFSKILKFVLPSIIMMSIFSLYTIVDGIFVSNYVGTNALGALNIIYPYQCLCIGLAVMFAQGGSAIVGKKLGEHDNKSAKEYFTMLICIELIISFFMMAIGLIFLKPLIKVLGASDLQLSHALNYLRLYLCFLPFMFLQNAFQTFFVTASKPHLGLFLIIFAGITNIFLDWLFLDICNMDVRGAALGTVLACMIPSVTGLIYFMFNKNGTIHFTKFKFNKKVILSSASNGSSEMVVNLANAITTFLFNYQCMKYYGDDGVAAITIILYFQFLISAIYFGYSIGIGPVFSYKYGHGDNEQIKFLKKTSIKIICFMSIVGYIIALFLIKPVSTMFAKNNQNVFNIVNTEFKWYAPAFLVFGISIFSSGYFTALGNGKISAIISFSRTIFFLSLSLILLPLIFKSRGIWISVPIAELLGFIISICYLISSKKKYLF